MEPPSPPRRSITSQLPLWLGHPVVLGSTIFSVAVSAIVLGYTLVEPHGGWEVLARASRVLMFGVLTAMTAAVYRRRRAVRRESR